MFSGSTRARLTNSFWFRNKNFWSWGRKKNEKEKVKIIKPFPEVDCDGREKKFGSVDPRCKIGVVFGGNSPTGLAAADSLLRHGAKVIILADEDEIEGERSVRNMCDFYGKNRARFSRCDLSSPCQLEGVLEETICRYEKIDVLFNDLDRRRAEAEAAGNRHCSRDDVADSKKREEKSSITATVINAGIKYMNREKNKDGGIIVSAASIIGFMGWPEDPVPVYCFDKEPVAETSLDLAKKYATEESGVRIVAILKSQKPFDKISLPDFPASNSRLDTDLSISARCELSAESRIGKALLHAMSRAQTGSCWLTEPISSAREIPWQIYFPAGPGESVDPLIYKKQESNYSSVLQATATSSMINCPRNCEPEVECKKFWKRKN